ncbi:protein ALP1-like, partial [Aphis craccivora]
MDIFSNEELLMIAVLLDEEEQQQIRRPTRNVWVHTAWKKRDFEGEFATLY